MAEERVFLESLVKPESGDRTVLSPVWIIPAETFTRGLLKRPAYDYSTVVLDAMTGNAIMALKGKIPWNETDTVPEASVLEPVIERPRAAFLAEKAIEDGARRGWRSIGSTCSVHVDPGKARLRWRLIILREGIPLDGLTGDRLAGSELLTALISETGK